MKILVLNCGSSSIKYQFLDMTGEPVLLAKGLLERIGIKDGELSHKRTDGKSYKTVVDIPDHTVGIKLVLEALTNPEYGVIKDVDEIAAVGHRVVHGAEKFVKSVLIDKEVRDKILECCDLAPLHNPANLKGIDAMTKSAPHIPQVAVFDTSFHQTMPKHAYVYGLPYEYYEKYRVRRYGFHGTSHMFVAEEACIFLKLDYKKTRIVTCHLGNGASLAAVKNGESIDTSMGMTPVEGVLMGTRCGDTGLGAVIYCMEKESLDFKALNNVVNKKSGLLGISGISPDMRDLQNAAKEGNERAALAIDVFVYKIRKYIGAYAFAMGGIDIIVFTGGIGENATMIRERVCSDLEFFGLKINKKVNDATHGQAALISTDDSKLKCIVMPTNEELVIARDTKKIIALTK